MSNFSRPDSDPEEIGFKVANELISHLALDSVHNLINGDFLNDFNLEREIGKDNQLLTNQANNHDRPVNISESNLYIEDVIKDLKSLKEFLSIHLHYIDDLIPCLEVDGLLIPYNYSSEVGGDISSLFHSMVVDSYNNLQGNKEVIFEKTSKVLNDLHEALANFLTARANSTNRGSGGNISNLEDYDSGSTPPNTPWNPPFIPFEVVTKNQGLSIYRSPAYFINWEYFAAPTSPAIGPILAGKHIFGAKGGVLKRFTKDLIPVSIPPHNSVIFTKF